MLRALALVLTVGATGCAASTAAPPRVVEHVVVVPAVAPVAPVAPSAPQHAHARPHHQHHACTHTDHADKPKARVRGRRAQAQREAHVHRDWEQGKKKRPSEKSQGDKNEGRTRPAPRASGPSAPGA